MTSKEQILSQIRQNNVVNDATLPSYDNFGITFDDKFSMFSKMLENVGGKALDIKKKS